MAKPTTLPAFNTGAANRTEPHANKKILGWIRGEKPASSYMNWLFYWIYAWVAYLNAGALEGNHSIDGDLDITGDLSVDGGATVGGDLHVTGDLTHGERTLNLDFVNGFKTGTWQLDAITFELETVGGSGTITITIPVLEGDRLKSCTVARYGNAADNIAVECYTMDALGDRTMIDADTAVAPAASWADTVLDLADTAVGAGEAVRLIIGAGGADMRAGTIRLVYDRPAAP